MCIHLSVCVSRSPSGFVLVIVLGLISRAYHPGLLYEA